MRSKMYWTLIVLLSVTSLIAGHSQAAYKIVENGVSDWHITISRRAIASERHAAKELQTFLKRISGADLFIVEYETIGAHPLLDRHNRLKTDEPQIIIGNNERANQLLEKSNIEVDFDKLGPEGFIIRTVGPHLLIAGGRPRGTLYGVYTFLENYLGCRWFDSTVSVIPKRSTIILGKINDTQIPRLVFRDTWFGMFKYDADLAVRNKINGVKCPLTEIHGGRFAYANPRYHSLDWLIPSAKYFKEHPEYYALVDGKRKPNQPCLTNPKVLKIVVQRVKEWMYKNPQQIVFDVSKNDGGGYCQCPKCKALDEKEDSHQGTLLTFVNNIADAVKDEFPDKYISTFAYHYTDSPPKTIRPRENVIIFFCTFCGSHLHNYDYSFSCGKGWGKNGSLGECIRTWSKITKNLFVWEYSGDIRHLLRPFPNFKIMKANMQFLLDNGVTGCFSQNTGHGRCGGLVPLQAYIFAKLAWDANYDVEKGIDEFVRGYYGKAADPMRRYIEMLCANVPEWGKPKKTASDSPWWLRPEMLNKYDELFNKAETLVQDDKNTLLRVKIARLGIQYEKLRTMPVDNPERPELMKCFFEVIQKAGISEIAYSMYGARHCTPAKFREYLEKQAKAQSK